MFVYFSAFLSYFPRHPDLTDSHGALEQSEQRAVCRFPSCPSTLLQPLPSPLATYHVEISVLSIHEGSLVKSMSSTSSRSSAPKSVSNSMISANTFESDRRPL